MAVNVWALDEARPVIESVDFDRLVLDVVAGGGPPVVAVDVGDDPADDVGAALSQLPVVAVAVGAGGDAWDVVTDDPEPVTGGVANNPHASVVAAQTLRLTTRLAPTDAWLVESLAYATLQAGPEHARWLASRGSRVRRDHNATRVTVIDSGHTVEVCLDRPRLHNLMDAAMRDQLVDVLKALNAARHDRAVILTGAGRSFCAGGDPAEFGTVSDPVTAHLIRSRAAVAPWLAAIADPVTARVHGACVGAGVELAALCGRVEVAPDARFRLPEVSMGLICGVGGMTSIPARIGRQNTLKWLLTNTELTATQALQLGLADRPIGDTDQR